MSSHEYESVIGLEIHAQLKTESKLFCSCSAAFGGADNEHTCPVCIGLPGALPVLNEKAIEMAVRLGLALNCEINPSSVFSRKNYFYPDLPKGYQISQYDEPICKKGHLEFYLKGERKRIGVTRAHLEEDAGKSIHHGNSTLVNLNRSSVPLLEIVSEPELRSAEEAAEYARSMRAIVQYTDICDGNLEEGSLRCDCNVSVRKKGETKFGTKVEIKNINSFRFVEKAIEFEIERQISSLEAGEKIIQETRLYDADKNRTFSMRTKEEAHDYRYFPDPDLLHAKVENALIEKVKKEMPELPVQRMDRYQKEYGLPAYDAQILTQTRAMAEYYEQVAKKSGNPKASSNWIMVELLAKLNEAKLEIENSPISSDHLAKLVGLIQKGTISGKIAKEVFADMFVSKKDPEAIVKEKGLTVMSDPKQIEELVEKIILAHAKEVAEYRGGKEKLFGFFVGQAMKASQGKASPELMNQILKEKLKG